MVALHITALHFDIKQAIFAKGGFFLTVMMEQNVAEVYRFDD